MPLDHYQDIAPTPGRFAQRPAFSRPREVGSTQEHKLAHQYARAYREIGQQVIRDSQRTHLTRVGEEPVHDRVLLQRAEQEAFKRYGRSAYYSMLGYLGESLARKFGYENFYEMQRAIDPRNPQKGKRVVKSICGPFLFFHEGQREDGEKSYLDHSYLHTPTNLDRMRRAVLQIPPTPGWLGRIQRFMHKVTPSGTMTGLVKWYEQATAFPS